MQTIRTGVAALVCAALAGAAVAAGRVGRLDVAGGSLAGELVPAPEVAEGARETFLWKSPRFAEAFEFRLGEVAGITFSEARAAAEPDGPCVQLQGGDVLPGTVEALDADTLVVAAAGPAGPQRLRIDRDEVTAILRTGAGGGSYTGPTGLTGWEQAPAGSWREEAGRILTDKAGAMVTADVATPARARFVVRLSRRRAAEFRISLAAAERPADDGYVIQSVGTDATGGLMLVRRTAGRAAIEPLPAPPWRDDVLRFVLFVDQERGRLAAVLPDADGADAGKTFEVTLAPSDPAAAASGRFRLELTAGEICLERLEVTPWRGEIPTLRDATETTIVTRTGAIDGFSVTGFDAARGEWTLARAGETRRVAAADLEEIRFPSGEDAALEPMIRVVCTDGATLSGDLVKVDDAGLWLRRRGIEQPVVVPADVIFTIRSQRPQSPGDEPGGRVGTFVSGDDRVRGWLAAVSGGIGWRPLGSVAAAALADEAADAEIEYVPRRPERKGNDGEVGGIGGLVSRDGEGFFIIAMMTEDGAAMRDGRIQPGDRIVSVAPTETSRFVDTQGLDNETVTHLLRGRVGAVVRLKLTDGAGANPREIELVRGVISVAGREILEQALQAHVRLAGAVEPPPGPPGRHPALVVLRSGDVAPCRIERIEGEELVLELPMAGVDAAAVRVPTDLVKAVELIPTAESRALDRTLLDRLLTLPRMQRNRPPTHLLRLLDGDYLRGRLVTVDEATVTFEVLDVVKQFPRSQVARLIWLHPEGARAGDDEAAEPAPASEPVGLLVQGVAADGRRVTLIAEGVDGDSLRGRSRAFGASTIDIGQVDRLLVGAAIGRDGRELPFAKWTLRPAPEPRALTKPAGD